MRPYQIFSDSSCDLPDNLLKKHQIGLIPFYVSFDQVNYYKENIDITKEAFYETLESKDIYAKTSLPSVNDYISMFKPVLKEAATFYAYAFRKLSGSYQSAINAKQILRGAVSSFRYICYRQHTGYRRAGILLLQTAMKEAGLSLEEATQKQNIENHCKDYVYIKYIRVPC